MGNKMLANNLEVSFPNLAWSSNLDINQLDYTITTTINKIAEIASELLREAQANLQIDPDFYNLKKNNPVPLRNLRENDLKYLDGSCVKIPRKVLKNFPDETKFYAKLIYKLDLLIEQKEKNSLKKLF